MFKDGALPAAAAAVDEALDGHVARIRERGDFRGRPDETLVLYPAGVQADRVALLGLGERDDYDGECLRRAAGSAVRVAERLGAAELCFTPPGPDEGGLDELARSVQAAAEGVVLAAWDYRELKTEPDEDQPRTELDAAAILVTEATAALEAAARAGGFVARGENLARELASKPGNVATPSHLAEVAEGIAAEHGLVEVTVLDRSALEEERMGALLAVAAGSDEEPKLIVLEYRGGPTTRRRWPWWGRASPSTRAGSPSSRRRRWRR